MSIAPRAFMLFPAVLLGAAASAQTRPEVRIEQQAAPVPASAQVDAPQISERAAAAPVAQVPRSAGARDAVRQLTTERRGTSAGAQVSRGPRTARESDPLSTPREGRTGAVARVEGEDRCAPGAAGERPEVCARPIETRSAEFQRPRAATLSAEQQLLVDQQLREAGLVARAANSRRMSPDELDPDNLEGQSIASVALDRGAGRDVGADGRDAATAAGAPLTGVPEAAAALIEIILGNTGAQPPQ